MSRALWVFAEAYWLEVGGLRDEANACVGFLVVIASGVHELAGVFDCHGHARYILSKSGSSLTLIALVVVALLPVLS